jgi:hypothetical protein
MLIPAVVRAHADALLFICYSSIEATYGNDGKEPADMLAVGLTQREFASHNAWWEPRKFRRRKRMTHPKRPFQ